VISLKQLSTLISAYDREHTIYPGGHPRIGKQNIYAALERKGLFLRTAYGYAVSDLGKETVRAMQRIADKYVYKFDSPAHGGKEEAAQNEM